MQSHQTTAPRQHRQRSRSVIPSGWTYSPLSLGVMLIVIGLAMGAATIYFGWDYLPSRVQYVFRAVEAKVFPPAPHAVSLPTPVTTTDPEQTLQNIVLPTSVAVQPVAAVTTAATAVIAEGQASEGASTSSTATAIPPTAVPPTAVPVAYAPVQAAMQLQGIRHEYQGWNNCGPATLGMQLSFFGRPDTQAVTAPALKPDSDDKNVNPDEMAHYAQSVGLGSQVVVGMDTETLKLLISNNFPVIVESWFIPEPNDEMGHYLLAKGYDADKIYFYDSYHGPDVNESWAEFDHLWKVFNRTAVVVWPAERQEVAQAILGERTDPQRMYSLAMESARREIEADSKDKFAWFNLGSSLAGLGEYEYAAQAFDTARGMSLPWRMLWYQFDLYRSYYETGRYQELVDLTSSTLHGVDNLEENHYWRGRAYAALGNNDEARADFQRALKFNRNYTAAQDALNALP